MSLRNVVITEAADAMRSDLGSIVNAAERRRMAKEAMPAFWYRFHSTMAMRVRSRPFGRVRARWHRYRAMRFEALAIAASKAGNPIAWALCDGVERATGAA